MSSPVIDPILKDLMESASTGEAVKMFLQSELGRSITNRAVEEIDEAMAELVEADADNRALISSIQNRIKVPSRAISWLTDAMAEGDNAMMRLNVES